MSLEKDVAEILARVTRMEKFMLEMVRDDCLEPEIVDVIFNWTNEKMEGGLNLVEDGDGLWRATKEGMMDDIVSLYPIQSLRVIYREWRRH